MNKPKKKKEKKKVDPSALSHRDPLLPSITHTHKNQTLPPRGESSKDRYIYRPAIVTRTPLIAWDRLAMRILFAEGM